LTQNTGNWPSIMSRRLPPPMPVAAPSRMKPNMSMRLRDATSAPVTAKIAMPNQSSAVSQLTCMCVCSARQSKAEIP
jgi:hypothetical protein